jgi:diguanylate cyclase (GGDEF)-like protein
MELDTLRIATALSSASLMVALLIGWLQARQESFLMHAAAGVVALVAALLLMGFRDDPYRAEQQVIPFTLILMGASCIYSSTRRFHTPTASIAPVVTIALVSVICTIAPLFLGYSGITGILLNSFCAVVFWLCAYECYRGHKEAPLPVLTNAALFALTGISFACCTYVMVTTGTWVVVEIPENWAETFNSIMSLVCMTCVGAITLTLHHARSAALHKDEANTDALTGILNRRALFTLFEAEKFCEGHAVIMFDLDHFKQINDHFGHAHGDRVLRQFADVLKECLRDGDLIARLGGEEFCVVLKAQDKQGAQLIADRIRRAFAALVVPIDHAGKIATVSAGVAIGAAEETFPAALRRADAALYEAKRSGRNQVQIATLRLVA